jgi:hypothetical protein
VPEAKVILLHRPAPFADRPRDAKCLGAGREAAESLEGISGCGAFRLDFDAQQGEGAVGAFAFRRPGGVI